MAKNFVCAIEITETHIKLLQAKTQKGLVITYGDARKIEQASDEHVAQLVAEMAASGNAIGTGDIIGIIPRRFAILKHIKLPSQSDLEIKRMLVLQIGNHVPYPREDIVFDAQVLSKDANGYSQILLSIIHKDVIHRYLQIFEKARLQPQWLTLSSFGTLEWASYQFAKNKEDPSATALINIDDKNSEICFVHQKKILFSRSIHFGAADFTSESLSEFMEQIGLTLGNYKKENMGPEIRKILVLTHVREAGLLVEKLKEYYQVPIEVRTPFDNLPCHKDFDFSVLWRPAGLSFVNCAGFLLNDARRQINFMPLSIQAGKHLERQKKAWLKTAAMVCVTGLLLATAAHMKLSKEEGYLKKVEEKVKETQAQAQNSKAKIESIDFLRQKMTSPILIADIVRELYHLCPPEISFNALYLDSQGTLTIQGLATLGSSVNGFQRNLVNSPLFKAVNLEFATKRKRLQEEYTDFKITCKLAAKESQPDE